MSFIGNIIKNYKPLQIIWAVVVDFYLSSESLEDFIWWWYQSSFSLCHILDCNFFASICQVPQLRYESKMIEHFILHVTPWSIWGKVHTTLGMFGFLLMGKLIQSSSSTRIELNFGFQHKMLVTRFNESALMIL